MGLLDTAFPTIPTIVAGTQLVSGLYRTLKADSELKKLMKKPLAQYKATPELMASKSRADQMAKGGFSPEENAAYEQQLARSQNTAYSRATNIAPNMAGAINAGINYTNIGTINSHAAQDAQLHRQNIRYADTFANYLQELNNKNINEQLGMTKAAFGALGQGKREGINEIFSAPSTFAALYTAGQGGGAGSSPATRTPGGAYTELMPKIPITSVG